MFKYDQPSFAITTEIMRSVCEELGEYEKEIGSLSSLWNKNPDFPAPRQRLRQSLEKLEQRETSLNLMRRNLEFIARVYENAEQEILEVAEEPVIVRDSGESAAGQNNVDFSETIRNPESLEASGLIDRMSVGFSWKSLTAAPLNPWYPLPYWQPPRPPRPAVFRRQGRFHWRKQDFVRMILEALTIEHRLPTGFIPWIPPGSNPADLSLFQTVPLIRPDSIDAGWRQSRRIRIRSLFGTDRR